MPALAVFCTSLGASNEWRRETIGGRAPRRAKDSARGQNGDAAAGQSGAAAVRIGCVASLARGARNTKRTAAAFARRAASRLP